MQFFGCTTATEWKSKLSFSGFAVLLKENTLKPQSSKLKTVQSKSLKSTADRWLNSSRRGRSLGNDQGRVEASSGNPSGHIRSTCWATSVRNWDRNFDRKPVIFETLAPFRDLPDVFAVRHRLVADIRATGKPWSKPVRRSARSIRHGISGIARETHRQLPGKESSECGRQVAPVAGTSRCRITQ